MQAFPDRDAMYKYGSVVYGLMFIVTYPAFAQFSRECHSWGLARVAGHSFASSLAVCGQSVKTPRLKRMIQGVGSFRSLEAISRATGSSRRTETGRTLDFTYFALLPQ